ncbi:hypothetical protein UNDKW_0061 [Undibacterium sp. KW1]|uniref:iron-containing redox enzyme family protein n=1 Tax=Undibacterium sp. KW1 TaxID=2058624 RepID=UPI001331EFF4|nr:iron-containing redox enzyme family protein [Undibacterium sp. KW1]BBB58334.1 hypothetical protein UNDKW_0061 [Undibacterium sp. KW1]
MDFDFKPRLRHCTLIKTENSDSLTIVVGTDYFSVETTPENYKKLLALKSMFDGRRTIGEIANIQNLTINEVLEVVTQFKEMKLLSNSSQPSNYISGRDFIEQISATSTMWARQIGYHRLFTKLSSGTTTRAVAIGLFIESFHYVGSAARHISTAIAHASDPRAQKILARYLSEEHDHSHIFKQALMKIGVPNEHLATAHPTIGTISLTNMLCEIGRHSSLAYIACTSLFEARAADADQAETEFRAICELYEIPKESADLFITHFRADISAGHTSLLSEYVRDTDEIPTTVAHEAVNYMHDLKHSFDQYHDHILAYYEDISNYIPRPKVDYFCL